MEAIDLARETAALLPAAEQMFAELRGVSIDGEGVTREAFGARETAAQEVITRFARAEGLRVERDRAANLIVSLPGCESDERRRAVSRREFRPRGGQRSGEAASVGGPYERFIGVGSHLDSVPCGGNYDGAAGVVAGLLALALLVRNAIKPPRPIRLLALRGEESAWFGKSWIGSRALLGLLSGADLAQRRSDTGRTLLEHLRDVDADVDAIAAREPLLHAEAMAAFLEVHIEQGPVLEAHDLPLGIVTSIYGNLRHRRVRCTGEPAHAGATPRSLRRDAVVAVSDFILRLDARWSEWLEAGRHITVTHGIVGTDPREHAISRVAGSVDSSLEIRAENEEDLLAFHDLARAEAAAVAEQRGVSFAFDEPIVNLPAAMDPAWANRFEQICNEERIASLRMPSGAGHDSAVFAHAGIPTAMLFIRNQCGSHNPREAMHVADFGVALRVLVRALLGAAA